MKCDYSTERWGDDYCMLTDAKVSYEHYCDYCKRDNKKSCRYTSTGRSTSKGDAAMNKTATCPHCGYIGHLVCVSGDIGTYSCDRCHKMFKAFI